MRRLLQPPRVVTVMEPRDGMRLAPAELVASLRDEIYSTVVLRRRRLDLDTLRREGEAKWCREGERTSAVRSDAAYALGVKWPARRRYLPVLPDTKFVVCVRHPLETIGSYKQAGGRVPARLHYDTAFNRGLKSALLGATDDQALRPVLLFDYIHERLLPFLDRPNVLVVRYERWFQDLPGLLSDFSDFFGVFLSSVPVRLRPPKSRSVLTEETDLVRRHCRTAEPLGYQLDAWPDYVDTAA